MDKELKKQIKKCKRCKINLKNNKPYCEKHIVLGHIGYLLTNGTKLQDKYPINKKFEALENFTKAIALGIEYLINK